jgi:hypothetical protein
VRVAKYFFHIDDGERHPDARGIDLPDVETARLHAARSLGERLMADPESFWRADELRVDVTNESGLLLYTIHCAGVIAPAGR